MKHMFPITISLCEGSVKGFGEFFRMTGILVFVCANFLTCANMHALVECVNCVIHFVDSQRPDLYAR